MHFHLYQLRLIPHIFRQITTATAAMPPPPPIFRRCRERRGRRDEYAAGCPAVAPLMLRAVATVPSAKLLPREAAGARRDFSSRLLKALCRRRSILLFFSMFIDFAVHATR